MTSEKVRENRVRRMAKRHGYRLEKSRRRDPLALDFGQYRLTGRGRPRTFGDLGAVEAFLNTPIPGRHGAAEQPLTPSG
jgi:hypothetical protein